jgi:hypothetical protein
MLSVGGTFRKESCVRRGVSAPRERAHARVGVTAGESINVMNDTTIDLYRTDEEITGDWGGGW